MEKIIFNFKRRETISPEEKDVLNALNEIRESMGQIYDKLNYSSNDLMTDSLSYELLALKARHRYFLERAKEMKLTRI